MVVGSFLSGIVVGGLYFLRGWRIKYFYVSDIVRVFREELVFMIVLRLLII